MLHLDEVTVRYDGSETPALVAASLRVAPGEIVALVGPSGAGKTTVLAVSSGRVLPTSGTAEILGVESSGLARRRNRSVRARIGAVHQGNALVGPLPVVHNVTAGRLGRWSTFTALRSLIRPIALDEVSEVLDQVGIADKLWERSDRLSGGEQQRTAIARTLFQDPDLWLVDEPVSALDPARSDGVMTTLVKAAGHDRAMVVSLHNARLAVRHCHRIVGLRQGHVLFDLPAAEVDDDRLDRLYALTPDHS